MPVCTVKYSNNNCLSKFSVLDSLRYTEEKDKYDALKKGKKRLQVWNFQSGSMLSITIIRDMKILSLCMDH